MCLRGERRADRRLRRHLREYVLGPLHCVYGAAWVSGGSGLVFIGLIPSRLKREVLAVFVPGNRIAAFRAELLAKFSLGGCEGRNKISLIALHLASCVYTSTSSHWFCGCF